LSCFPELGKIDNTPGRKTQRLEQFRLALVTPQKITADSPATMAQSDLASLCLRAMGLVPSPSMPNGDGPPWSDDLLDYLGVYLRRQTAYDTLKKLIGHKIVRLRRPTSRE